MGGTISETGSLHRLPFAVSLFAVMSRLLRLLLLAAALTPAAARAQVAPLPATTRPPVLIDAVTPVYPDSALALGLTGRVEVRARVDTLGRVLRVEVTRSAGAAFDSSAVEAVRQWRFRPGTQNGRLVAAWVRLPVQFTPEYIVDDLKITVSSATARMRFPAEIERGELRDEQVTLGPGSLVTTGFGLRPEVCDGSFLPAVPIVARISGVGMTQYFTEGQAGSLAGARSVVVQYLVNIGEDGYAGNVVLARASGYIFDDLLRNALEQWTYQPARCGGKRVASKGIVTFNLRNRSSARLFQAPTDFGGGNGGGDGGN